MRHGKKFNHLGRTASHRSALLSNMAVSLINNKRINTTVAKAKALKKYVEPLVTKAKSDTTHSRRVVFSYLQDKYAVSALFGEVAQRVGTRPGGYTRIIKTGTRLGDAAETCLIELVDFNEIYLKEGSVAAGAAKKTTRRRGSSKKSDSALSSDETVASGVKPAADSEAKTSEGDDLKKVEGIGPKIAEIFNENGIMTFSDLAAKTEDDLRTILEAAGSRYKSKNPASWPMQAGLAAEGKWDELNKWQDENDNGIEK